MTDSSAVGLIARAGQWNRLRADERVVRYHQGCGSQALCRGREGDADGAGGCRIE